MSGGENKWGKEKNWKIPKWRKNSPVKWVNTNFLQIHLDSRKQHFWEVVVELFPAEQIHGHQTQTTWKSCLATLMCLKNFCPTQIRVQKGKNVFLMQERGTINSLERQF